MKPSLFDMSQVDYKSEIGYFFTKSSRFGSKSANWSRLEVNLGPSGVELFHQSDSHV